MWKARESAASDGFEVTTMVSATNTAIAPAATPAMGHRTHGWRIGLAWRIGRRAENGTSQYATSVWQ